jgi:hypothetical protein
MISQATTSGGPTRIATSDDLVTDLGGTANYDKSANS